MAITYEDGCIYNATVQKTGMIQASTGTPGFRIFIKIDSEIVNGEEKACPNYDRDITYYLTQNTKKFFERDMGKLGITVDRQAMREGLSELIGKTIQVRCKHNDHEGKTQEKFELYFGSTKVVEASKEAMEKAFDLFEERQERKFTTPKLVAKSAVEIAAEEVF